MLVTIYIFGCHSCHKHRWAKSLTMPLSDNTGREVARFHRPFKLTCRCCTCYCPCCLQEMEITASGQVVGYILQKQDFCNPKFQICDADKKVLLELKGPVCVFSCFCNDIDFDVRASNPYNIEFQLHRFWLQMETRLEKLRNNGQVQPKNYSPMPTTLG